MLKSMELVFKKAEGFTEAEEILNEGFVEYMDLYEDELKIVAFGEERKLKRAKAELTYNRICFKGGVVR